MLDLATARKTILEHPLQCSHEVLSLTDACGHVLASDIYARRSNPIQDLSMMDGYAVADSPTEQRNFQLVGEAPAGTRFDKKLMPGEALRVFTGSAIADGTTRVIMQEDVRTDISDDGKTHVIVQTPPSSQDFIRRKGSDFQKDDLLFRKGHQLTARDIGVLAATGIIWIDVAKPLTVGILATGDEISMPGMASSHQATYNSSAFMLQSLCKQAGACPHIMPVAKDNKASLKAAFEKMRHFDILVTIGGVSVGDYDLIEPSLEEDSFKIFFHKVAIKPGKPFLFGKKGNALVFSLPGNPVASYVCALMFLLPSIGKALGKDVPQDLPTCTALLGTMVPQGGKRLDFLRAHVVPTEEGMLLATPFARQDSAQLLPLSRAQALIIRPPHAPRADKGERCQILLLQ